MIPRIAAADITIENVWDRLKPRRRYKKRPIRVPRKSQAKDKHYSGKKGRCKGSIKEWQAEKQQRRRHMRRMLEV